MNALRREKEALRATMRRVRGSIPPEERLRLAGDIEANLLRLPAIGEGRTLLLFYSFGSEVPTAGILQRLLDRGVRVLLPFLEGREMDAAELRPGESLAATTYGPREPSRLLSVDPADVDVVIAPGLAFDARGHRLGYGGGHYDRYLARLRPDTPRIGIAFHVQVIPRVPHGPEDQLIDFVVTEVETITCPPRLQPG